MVERKAEHSADNLVWLMVVVKVAKSVRMRVERKVVWMVE